MGVTDTVTEAVLEGVGVCDEEGVADGVVDGVVEPEEEGEGDGVDVGDGEDKAPHPAVQRVPTSVPPFGHEYTGVAGCVIVHVVPDRIPPWGHVYSGVAE